MQDVTNTVRQVVNTPVRPEDHAKLFRGVFAHAREHFEEQMLEEREPTGQDFVLWSLCRPERAFGSKNENRQFEILSRYRDRWERSVSMFSAFLILVLEISHIVPHHRWARVGVLHIEDYVF